MLKNLNKHFPKDIQKFKEQEFDFISHYQNAN